MRTNLRQELLATTALLVGTFGYSAPAAAQNAPPASDQPSTSTTTTQPAGPEAQPAPAAPTEAEAPPAPAPTQQASSEIIITGSRIPQPNLTSAAPITVVSDQDVKLSGSTRIEDVLNQLPSVGASQASGQSNGATGTAEVDLRYLGSKRSLSLVNGRRLTPGDPAGTTQAADLNLIPSALIKRVEVLTGGASSVYGADAVGGVVNFIMDTHFEGIRFDGNWGIYQHNQDDPSVGGGLHMSDILNAKNFPIPGDTSGGRQIDGTVTIGTAFDDGRGHAVAYFGYRKVNAILQGKRDYSACVIQNTRAGAATCGGSATANPGNIFLFTHLSATTSTTAALGPGTLTLGNGPNIFNFGPLNYFQRPDERYTAGAFADYEINDAIKPYLEFMFMDDRTLAQIAPSGDFFNTTSFNCNNPLMSAQQQAIICNPANLVVGFIGNFPVAAGAPYNTPENGVGSTVPLNFTDPTTGTTYQRGFGFLARRNTEGGPRIADLKHTSYRGLLGSKGNLSNVWSYDASFQYGRVNYEQVFKNEFSQARLVRALDVVADPRTGSPTFGQPVCRSVLTGDDPNCVPYDVFGAAPSQASINYLNVNGLITGQTSEQIGNVNFTGALGEWGIQTPWSDQGVGVNLGYEYRKESLELNPDALFQAGDLTGQGAPTLPVNGDFTVNELFFETQIPIIRHSFIDEFSIGAGYRKSWYKLSSGRKYDTDTYKISAELAPIPDVRLRGSYNRAVRAPNIAELFSPVFVGLDGTKDPCAGHQIQPTEFGCIASGLPAGQGTPANPAGQYNGLLGGNVNLSPEKASTITAGVVLQPRFLPRFALTIDYWNIDLKHAIQGFGADAIITACINQTTASFVSPACSLVHRSPAGSIWLTPDGFIVDTPNNDGRIRTDGWDISSSYNHRLGGFLNFLGTVSMSFNGTYLHKYKVDNGLTQAYDCAGLYGPVCSSGVVASSAPMPKWRHKARLGFQMPFGLGLSAQWRYVGKVKAETLEDNETLHGAFNFDPTLHVKAQNYFDLSATYTLLDRVNLRAGVNNVFDNDPPLVTSGSATREGSNLCPTGPCNGNTFPGTWDALGRLFFAGVTVDFIPKHTPPPAPPPPAPPPPPPPATQTCPDGTVIEATATCPAPPPPPPPPPPAPQRG